MELMNLMAEIEALLYVSGDAGMTIKRLMKLTSKSESEVQREVDALKKRYASTQFGLCILQNVDIIHMSTKREYADVVQKFAKADDDLLTQSALETLTIIAYKQPVTRIEVDNVRGVNSSISIRNLLTQNLIKVDGEKNEPGKPKLYGTTDLFLSAFNIEKIDDLPELDEGKDPKDYVQMFDDEMKPLEDQ
ncbi:segregation and condensation protein B [Fructilactobacillus fructivorans]|nr:segregation and condensation protein B [Fructilactobacillus fructivorans]